MVRITFAVGLLALVVISDVFSTAQALGDPSITMTDSSGPGKTPPSLGELLQGLDAQDQNGSALGAEGEVSAQELMPEAPASFSPEASGGSSISGMTGPGTETIPAISFGENSGLGEMVNNLGAGGVGAATKEIPKKCIRSQPLAPQKSAKCHCKNKPQGLQQGQWGGQGQESTVTEGSMCDGKPYISSTHTCNRTNGREYLCPIAHDSCGEACYQPSQYSCLNGKLVAIGEGGGQQPQWRPDHQQQGQSQGQWQPQGQGQGQGQWQPQEQQQRLPGQQLPEWQQGQQQPGQIPEWQQGQQQPGQLPEWQPTGQTQQPPMY